MQIESLEGNLAVVDVAGARRQVSVALLENAMVGDYVLVHAGFAIHKINQHEAEETLKLLSQMGRDHTE